MPATRHYFSNALGSIDFVPGAYVQLRWSGQPLSSPELRALYIHVRNVLERKGLHCLLVDHRAMASAPDAADQQWLLTQWLPETAARTRATHYAALPAPDPARRLHTEPVVQDLRRYLSVALFDDPEQAAAWFDAA
ncbi:hypothetical protein LJ737_21035 [Hymenobacter sp. 15J16-1T3B]|uniref:hypothetical protein n=1 Tax=Hymenobacter sp. 15J16-1T3B TaxID=2886941 RepID=UPI001D12DE1F|nr:hypothetical protein [Hymenobacter sp. 15J16-1T3B]MCC3159740.1 hypothetical protein [Hymenobacter sp. 15J16-1T3B]